MTRFVLVTFKKARELNLKGKPMKLSVVKVGVKEEINPYQYNLSLIDRNGEVVQFQAYGIERNIDLC